MNIPLAAFTLVFTVLGVTRDTPAPAQTWRQVHTTLDLPGIVLFAALVTGTLVFLAGLKAPAWWLAPVLASLAVALWVQERRTRSPLIDVRMLAGNLPLQRTYLRQMLVALGIYTSLYGSSQWMEQSLHLGASAVGLILLPLSVFSIVVARVVSTRGWLRWPLVLAGVSLMLVGGVMLFVNQRSGVPVLVGMSLVLGIANGCSSFANQAALYVQAPAEEIAVASGLFRTFNYVGAIFSSSLIGITFGSAATDRGFHSLAWVLAGSGLLVAFLAAFDRTIPVTTA